MRRWLLCAILEGGDAVIAIKYFMFIGLELFVVVLLAAVLIKLLKD